MFHIRGPKPQYSVVGESSSITCSIAAPEFDETFEMFVDGISYREIRFDAQRTRTGLENGTVVTNIAFFADELIAEFNLTVIRCLSLKYDGEISLTINLRPANASKLYPLTYCLTLTLVFSSSALPSFSIFTLCLVLYSEWFIWLTDQIEDLNFVMTGNNPGRLVWWEFVQMSKSLYTLKLAMWWGGRLCWGCWWTGLWG